MAVKKILIVDDSPTDRQFFMETLSKHGYQCVTAENGDEAITKAKSEKPDLILMDVVMPGTNGFQATRAITSDEATKHIPVIVVTSKNFLFYCFGDKREVDSFSLRRSFSARGWLLKA